LTTVSIAAKAAAKIQKIEEMRKGYENGRKLGAEKT